MKATKSQQRAIKRIEALFEQNDGITTVHTKVEHTSAFASVSVRTKRNDCDEFSPRQVLCADGGHFIVTRNGAITVCSTYKVCSDEHYQQHTLLHYAYMLNAKMSGERRKPTRKQRSKQCDRAYRNCNPTDAEREEWEEGQ